MPFPKVCCLYIKHRAYTSTLALLENEFQSTFIVSALGQEPSFVIKQCKQDLGP